MADAIVNNERTFFNLSQEAMEQVVDLNLNGPFGHHRFLVR